MRLRGRGCPSPPPSGKRTTLPISPMGPGPSGTCAPCPPHCAQGTHHSSTALCPDSRGSSDSPSPGQLGEPLCPPAFVLGSLMCTRPVVVPEPKKLQVCILRGEHRMGPLGPRSTRSIHIRLGVSRPGPRAGMIRGRVGSGSQVPGQHGPCGTRGGAGRCLLPSAAEGLPQAPHQ